jgi:putative MFS transporter
MQLPMYYYARMNHYRLAGMGITPQMYAGMVLIVGGTLLAGWGLVPRQSDPGRRASRIQIRALDAAPIKRSHVALLIVLAIALIDIMKPTTLAFVAPGAATEYGLRGPLNPHAHGLPIALYPLSGITGTVLGSFIWGALGDRIGCRASILIAAVIFISTSTCGAMPAYWLNLVCCLFMGIGVGGMLPIALTLMSWRVRSKTGSRNCSLARSWP